ncbi:hypothetical protein DS742_16305 [Lacrimispora amygdalina]|uniref:Uncharacterized protein n=1 Tax=Lacrimispora amygdalina TaxID=253257 RepID=A0A3E2N9W8_9FIRM|nr:hypothetical protein [Clostridium indicum]RFZ77815.1 hypothetical protein DS742_16305 [Clostridium indicum]
MGNRAVFLLHEQGESYYFTAHHGANALSPLLRLTQAKQLQEQLPQPQSIAHIFEHLDYDGKYQPERLQDSDMFFQAISLPEMKVCLKDFQNRSNFEMRFIIDLDRNDFQMTYNPNCPWYRTMGSFTIDLDVGIDNVKKLLAHAEERNIKDFGRLLTIYENSTGLADKLESARGYMRFEEYLDSPQAEEDRRRYRELIDRQAEPDEEEMEER